MVMRRMCIAPAAAAARRRRFAAAAAIPQTYKDMEAQGGIDAPLARDVRHLGKVLGQVLEAHAPAALPVVKRLRKAAREGREATAGEPTLETLGSLRTDVVGLRPSVLRDVARAFAHHLALTNAAETRHRVRRLRSTGRNSLASIRAGDGDQPTQEVMASNALPAHKLDSCAGTLGAIMDIDGATPQAALAQLAKQKVEIVLTAHPTEVHRRTMLTKVRLRFANSPIVRS